MKTLHIASLVVLGLFVALAAAHADPADNQQNSEETIGGKVQLEFFGAGTFGLQGARALIATSTQVVDSGERKSLPSLGFAANTWFGKRKIVGSFLDFSVVDAGKASASLAGISSQASGSLADFHSGFQVQAPFRRVRPYASFGGGVAHLSSDVTFKAGSFSQNFKDGITLPSLTYGGGVRFMAGQRWGLRTAVEGVTLTGQGPGRTTYPRMIVGLFWSSR